MIKQVKFALARRSASLCIVPVEARASECQLGPGKKGQLRLHSLRPELRRRRARSERHGDPRTHDPQHRADWLGGEREANQRTSCQGHRETTAIRACRWPGLRIRGRPKAGPPAVAPVLSFWRGLSGAYIAREAAPTPSSPASRSLSSSYPPTPSPWPIEEVRGER
jgi:hypothetical protein